MSIDKPFLEIARNLVNVFGTNRTNIDFESYIMSYEELKQDLRHRNELDILKCISLFPV